MAYTTIDKSDDYFNTVLYTGNGSTQSVTGVGFQPDLVWVKCRNDSFNHANWDIVRGTSNALQTSTTSAEQTIEGVTSFDSDGFTLSTAASTNSNTKTFVAWNWLASGTGVSNTDGSIASTVSANTTAGFSIVSYTGNITANATVGHGLGDVPKFIIVKNRAAAAWDWTCYHASLGNTRRIFLNSISAGDTTSAGWNNTTPSSLVVTLGAGRETNNDNTLIMYCFAEKKGFSKFGSYTGNGSTDGTFVYTGFKPAFVMIKSNTNDSEWAMFDNKRNSFNETINVLRANSSAAEIIKPSTDNTIDILSNGFKIRDTGGWVGTSGRGFIYTCFAENPLVTSTGIPTTAR
jgi:hypothetical protein